MLSSTGFGTLVAHLVCAFYVLAGLGALLQHVPAAARSARARSAALSWVWDTHRFLVALVLAYGTVLSLALYLPPVLAQFPRAVIDEIHAWM